MPHEKNKIRVRRKGKGHGAVTTDCDDETIGEAGAVIVWVKRPPKDPDPGDDFEFDLTIEPIAGLPDPLFKPKDKSPDRVSMTYAGCSSSSPKVWNYTINVIDVKRGADGHRILSDGSATIKNK